MVLAQRPQECERLEVAAHHQVLPVVEFVARAAVIERPRSTAGIGGGLEHDDVAINLLRTQPNSSGQACKACSRHHDRTQPPLGQRPRTMALSPGDRRGDALADGALTDLSDAVERTQCQNVLVSVNGTMFEGSAGADAAWHFMRGRGYDCLVSVAYHDSNGGWGEFTSDDTLMLCESAELGLDAIEPAWEAAVVTPGVEQWDMFGHSKGGASVVKFYQRRWNDLRAWSQARVYTIGLPWRMGAQYLPTPDDYEPGRIYAHEQIVAFTWTNDAVGDIESCVDVDAVRLSETHDYTPMFSRDVDDHVERSAIRDDFVDGVERWVGERY